MRITLHQAQARIINIKHLKIWHLRNTRRSALLLDPLAYRNSHNLSDSEQIEMPANKPVGMPAHQLLALSAVSASISRPERRTKATSVVLCLCVCGEPPSLFVCVRVFAHLYLHSFGRRCADGPNKPVALAPAVFRKDENNTHAGSHTHSSQVECSERGCSTTCVAYDD